MMTIALTAIWLLGVFASLGAMDIMGSRDENTIGECFSGDYGMDMGLAALWPIWWPCFFAYKLGAWATRKIGGQ